MLAVSEDNIMWLVMLIAGIMQVVFIVAILRIASAHESLARSIGELISHLKAKDKAQ